MLTSKGIAEGADDRPKESVDITSGVSGCIELVRNKVVLGEIRALAVISVVLICLAVHALGSFTCSHIRCSDIGDAVQRRLISFL